MADQDLTQSIKAAAEKAFRTAMNFHPNEEFCAFGLYSDEGAMTVCPSSNTKSYLAQKIKVDPEEKLYYKWSTAEWKLEFYGHEWFEEIDKILKAFHTKKHNQKDFENFQSKLFESCVLALEQLKTEGLFNDAIVVFSVSDYINTPLEISWIKRLNNNNEAEEFEKWAKEQDE